MTKEQFLKLIRQSGKGKYINILNEYPEESLNFSGIEFINFLALKFDLSDDEKKEIPYQGIHRAVSKFKERTWIKKEQMTGQPILKSVNTQPPNSDTQPSKYQDSDEILQNTKSKFLKHNK